MTHLLFLMRHAQSADKQPGQSDRARELTAQGMQEAAQIGRLLKDSKYFPDLILASTAERAKQTAGLVAEAAKILQEKIHFEEELYTPSLRSFLSQINLFDESFKNIMCVAHNPTISYLAEYLTKSEIGDLPTAGLVIIQFNKLEWRQVSEGNGKLVRILTPKNN
jgi:phosphohistidine phosphatase